MAWKTTAFLFAISVGGGCALPEQPAQKDVALQPLGELMLPVQQQMLTCKSQIVDGRVAYCHGIKGQTSMEYLVANGWEVIEVVPIHDDPTWQYVFYLNRS